MIRHVLSVKLIFFDFPSDIGPTFCGMGELLPSVMLTQHGSQQDYWM